MTVFLRWMALTAAMLVCSLGRADVAVIRPLPDALTEAERRAQQAVIETLEAADMSVMLGEEALSRLRERAQAACLDVGCAAAALPALEADMLVSIVVGTNGDLLVDVAVQLADREGAYVGAEAPIEHGDSGDVGRAARAAIARALSKWSERGLVALRVEGEPLGATVRVDGEPKGELPLEVSLRPGEHVIAVSAEGKTAEKRVRLEAGMKETVGLRADLVGKGGVRKHVIGGAVLAAAGLVVGATAGTLVLVRGTEDCRRRGPQGGCVEADRSQVAPLALWTGGGALAVAGGITWLGIGIRRGRRPGAPVLDLVVAPSSLSLRGEF